MASRTAPARAPIVLRRPFFAFVIVAALLTCVSPLLDAQPRSAPSERDLLLMQAIEHIDNGKVDSARALLAEGIERYPNDPAFPYEVAYLHYALEEFSDAETILEKLAENPKAEEHVYQLLGNTYDMLGRTKEAIETYQRGLELFPSSGPLHLELGVIMAMHEDYAAAVGYWETGIEKAPAFPSNYYHAARMWMGTSERGWGMLYGEIFLNLEPGSQRSSETRKQLYDAWNKAITTEEGDRTTDDATTATVNIDLFEKIEMQADTTMAIVIPFEFFYVKSLATAAAVSTSPMTIATLHEIRRNFLQQWYQDTSVARHFDIELFARWRELERLGLFEAYDYMIFYTPGTASEVDAWSEKQGARLRDVTGWLAQHPIGSAKERPFARATVGGMSLSKEGLDAAGVGDAEE